MFKIFGNKAEELQSKKSGVFSGLIANKNLTPEQRKAEAVRKSREEIEKIGIEKGLTPEQFKNQFGFDYSVKAKISTKLFNKRG